MNLSEVGVMGYLREPRTRMENEKVFRACAMLGYESCIDTLINEYLMRRDFSISTNNDEALRVASARGYAFIVARLLGAGAYAGANDSEALRLASSNGHTQIVEMILSNERANPAARDSEALRLASARGHTAIVRLLLQNGLVDVNARNGEALREARLRGFREIVDMLEN